MAWADGCQDVSAPLDYGTADHRLDAWIAQDTAQFLCKYSRGSFPNWMLLEAYESYLEPEEAVAVGYIRDRLLEQIAPSRRPKYMAISAFIAEHTRCETELGGVAVKERDEETGAVGVRFLQQFPLVPNVPDIAVAESMTPKEQTEAWMKAFDREFDGKFMSRQVSIVVIPGGEHGMVLRSSVSSSFAEPLEVREFWSSLDESRFDEAYEHLVMICAKRSRLCEELTPFWESAVKYQRRVLDEFSQTVEVADEKRTVVVSQGGSSYTSVGMTVTNHGQRTLRNIVFTTDEVAPQLCRLQSERRRRDEMPLELGPGQSAKAWCALSGETRPWTKLSFWISD